MLCIINKGLQNLNIIVIKIWWAIISPATEICYKFEAVMTRFLTPSVHIYFRLFCMKHPRSNTKQKSKDADRLSESSPVESKVAYR
jgi:hypothetical protein